MHHDLVVGDGQRAAHRPWLPQGEVGQVLVASLLRRRLVHRHPYPPGQEATHLQHPAAGLVGDDVAVTGGQLGEARETLRTALLVDGEQATLDHGGGDEGMQADDSQQDEESQADGVLQPARKTAEALVEEADEGSDEGEAPPGRVAAVTRWFGVVRGLRCAALPVALAGHDPASGTAVSVTPGDLRAALPGVREAVPDRRRRRAVVVVPGARRTRCRGIDYCAAPASSNTTDETTCPVSRTSSSGDGNDGRWMTRRGCRADRQRRSAVSARASRSAQVGTGRHGPDRPRCGARWSDLPRPARRWRHRHPARPGSSGCGRGPSPRRRRAARTT